jgi:hypothetical protein
MAFSFKVKYKKKVVESEVREKIKQIISYLYLNVFLIHVHGVLLNTTCQTYMYLGLLSRPKSQ